MWKVLLALLQHKYNKVPTNMWYVMRFSHLSSDVLGVTAKYSNHFGQHLLQQERHWSRVLLFKIPRRYGRRLFPPHIEKGVLCISYRDRTNTLRCYPIHDGNILATLKQIDKDLYGQFRSYF